MVEFSKDTQNPVCALKKITVFFTALIFLLFVLMELTTLPYNQIITEDPQGISKIVPVIKQTSNTPNITKYVKDIMLPKGDEYTTQLYKIKARLSTQAMVIVCGEGMDKGCTNGIYPQNPNRETINEISQDPNIIQYWGEVSTHPNTDGRIGPVSQNTQIEASVSCRQTYCRITFHKD